MNNFLLYLAAVPPLFILFLVFLFSKQKKENERHITLAVFFLGCLIVIPAFILESAYEFIEPIFLGPRQSALDIFIFALFGVALIEEYCKFFILRYYAFYQKEFKTAYDGILYGVTTSLGFAFIENISYVFFAGSTQASLSTAIVRMYSAIPAHALMGIFMGYYLGKAKLDNQNQQRFLVYGLLSATCVHTLYNYFQLLPTPLYGYSFATLIVGFILALPRIKEVRDQESNEIRVNPNSISDVDNEEKSTYTSTAGSYNGKTCQKCQAKLLPTMKICQQCGTRI